MLVHTLESAKPFYLSMRLTLDPLAVLLKAVVITICRIVSRLDDLSGAKLLGGLSTAALGIQAGRKSLQALFRLWTSKNSSVHSQFQISTSGLGG